MARIYLDHNATTPLSEAARRAMGAAMDVLGNPSSVHAEGRQAKALVERARAQLAEAFGAEGADIVFTSGATEAAALALAGRGLRCAAVEHEAVTSWCQTDLPVDAQGRIEVAEPAASAVQIANSETGVVQVLPQGVALCDATQGFGKLPLSFCQLGADMGIISAHKLGGPSGIGALILRRGLDIEARIKGGGQEMGRRAGTENVIGIAGFAAAAQWAASRVAQGVWAQVAELRAMLEQMLQAEAQRSVIIGACAEARLPNTICIATPGWRGETQVMALDLAGVAVSAGSACSSGKVKASRVVGAMGYAEDTAASTLRVSMGPDTSKDDVLRFAELWLKAERKFHARAA